MDIVVLQKDEIETLVRRAAELAVAGLREELERTRTPDLMTTSQICDYLQCHRSTIDRHIKNGMPAERLGGDPRFRKTDIDLWLRGEYWDGRQSTARERSEERNHARI